MNDEIKKLANNVLSFKHLGLSDAMDRVLGGGTESNHDLYSNVYDAIQNILYPHGYGEDKTNCD